MTDTLFRVTMRKTTVNVSLEGLTVITGYVVEFEPETPAKREILRPVEPDERVLIPADVLREFIAGRTKSKKS